MKWIDYLCFAALGSVVYLNCFAFNKIECQKAEIRSLRSIRIRMSYVDMLRTDTDGDLLLKWRGKREIVCDESIGMIVDRKEPSPTLKTCEYYDKNSGVYTEVYGQAEALNSAHERRVGYWIKISSGPMEIYDNVITSPVRRPASGR